MIKSLDKNKVKKVTIIYYYLYINFNFPTVSFK